MQPIRRSTPIAARGTARRRHPYLRRRIPLGAEIDERFDGRRLIRCRSEHERRLTVRVFAGVDICAMCRKRLDRVRPACR